MPMLTRIEKLDDLCDFETDVEPVNIKYSPETPSDFLNKLFDAAPEGHHFWVQGKPFDTYGKGLVVLESTVPIQFYKKRGTQSSGIGGGGGV